MERAQAIDNFLLNGFEVISITGETVGYMLKHGYNAKEIEEFMMEASNDYARRIEEEAEKQFDPEVVMLFLELKEEI